MRRSVIIVGVVILLSLTFVIGPSLLFTPSADELAPEEEPEPEMYTPSDSDSSFWPYLNAREQHEKRSPLNVIVRGDTESVVHQLQEFGEEDWEETDHDHFDVDEITDEILNASDDENDDLVGGDVVDASAEEEQFISPTDVPWSQADGATRLAYVDPGAGEDTYWTTETTQLEDGEYYGYRYHIRLYESPNPDDNWVVMQTHSEHFDWLTLRHRVDGVEQAQYRLENDLMSIPSVDEQDDVLRVNLGNSGPSDADGWATKANLLSAGILFIISLQRYRNRMAGEIEDRLAPDTAERVLNAVDRVDFRHVVLLGMLVTIILGVRILGIAFDRHLSFLSVHMIAAILYPIIALGIPLSTYVIARGLERRLDAAIAASSSLAFAIWLDYGLLAVEVLPIDVIFQRVLLVIAIGLIAGGAAKRAMRQSVINPLLVSGIVLWGVVLLGTLFGYL